MGIEVAFGGENAEEVAFVGLGSLEDVESFLAGFEIPNIRLHMEKSCIVLIIILWILRYWH